MELKTLNPFLDRLLVALPVDRRDGRRALELQVAVLEVLVPHLKGSHYQLWHFPLKKIEFFHCIGEWLL